MAPNEAIIELKKIEDEVLAAPQVVAQLHTKLISLYLGYRDIKAYHQMEISFDRLPTELQHTAVATEQLALALNRLAEKKATMLRRKAIRFLDSLSKIKWTSETYGILGRIYKGQAYAEQSAGKAVAADSALQGAIETYEAGFRSDPRDYYPGVNAVPLRLLRGNPENADILKLLVPVVRFSVEWAPAPKDEMERYWQEATRLELACADKDWQVAKKILIKVVGIDVQPWMRETTIGNLKRQKEAFKSDIQTINTLDNIITEMQPS